MHQSCGSTERCTQPTQATALSARRPRAHPATNRQRRKHPSTPHPFKPHNEAHLCLHAALRHIPPQMVKRANTQTPPNTATRHTLVVTPPSGTSGQVGGSGTTEGTKLRGSCVCVFQSDCRFISRVTQRGAGRQAGRQLDTMSAAEGRPAARHLQRAARSQADVKSFCLSSMRKPLHTAHSTRVHCGTSHSTHSRRAARPQAGVLPLRLSRPPQPQAVRILIT